MSLFEECKNALKNDFQIVSDIDAEDVYTKLKFLELTIDKLSSLFWIKS